MSKNGKWVNLCVSETLNMALEFLLNLKMIYTYSEGFFEDGIEVEEV